MSKTKSNTKGKPKFDAQQAYRNQIDPALQALLRRCKHYGFPALVAVSVPLSEASGVTMTYMQPNKAGMIPTEFGQAQHLIEHPPQDTVTELHDAGDASDGAAQPEAAVAAAEG